MVRLVVGLLLMCSVFVPMAANAEDVLAQELSVLAKSKLSKLPDQIDVIAGLDDPRATFVLQALLDGDRLTAPVW